MSATENAANDAALRMLDDYYTAFSTLDVQAILPYFHEPSTLISSRGVNCGGDLCWQWLPLLKPTLEGLRAREFGRSELSVGSAKQLSASATLVLPAKRSDTSANGQEIGTGGHHLRPATMQNGLEDRSDHFCTTLSKARHGRELRDSQRTKIKSAARTP